MEKLANGLIKVSSYPYDRQETFSFNKNTSWVSLILEELEKERILDSDVVSPDSQLNLEFTVKKSKNRELSDYFLLQGTLFVRYGCSCIRCLQVFQKEQSLELKGCFLSEVFEQSEIFDDHGKALIENDEFDAFFYHDGFIDLKEFIHETIMMNVDHFPLHDENCKGLCPECGTDLNNLTCSHISK